MDELDLPLQFNWSNDDVLRWIESLGFPQYRETFQVNFINGKKLLLVDASALVKMNIKDFDHIKTITKSIREMYKIELDKFDRSISFPPKEPETIYKFYKIPTGPIYELCSRTDLLKRMRLMKEAKVPLNHFEKLHQWLLHIPDFQHIRVGGIKRINLFFIKANPHREVELIKKEETKCSCTMPPCECYWSKKEKREPWRLAFLMQLDKGKYAGKFCSKFNDSNSVNLILSKD